MKRLSIVFISLLLTLGLGMADYIINITPDSQNAISGSVVNFNVSATNNTGVGAFVVQNLPSQLKYKNSNILPANNPALALGLETVPHWNLSAGQTLNLTIQADVIVQSFPILNANVGVVQALNGPVLTSAVAQINPISDLFVEKRILSDSNDTVSYEIVAKNIGSAIATGIHLVEIWPSNALDFPNQATVNGVNQIPTIYNGQVDQYLFVAPDLAPGSSVVLQITGTKKATFPMGQQFTNEARVSTDSSQYNINNDIGSVSSSFLSNIAVDMTVFNLTDSTRNSLTGDSVLAVSGDIVELRITITNTGNLSATGNLILSNIAGFVNYIGSTNWTRFLLPGQSETIVLTGLVGPKNFVSFSPRIDLTYFSINKNASVTISEQLICGDGLITQNEQCDINELNPNLFPGQICVEENGVCILRTEGIPNTVCIDFVTNAGTGQQCSTVTIEYQDKDLALCDNIYSTGNSILVNERNQGSMQFSCSSQNNVIANEIRIDCGNGQIGRANNVSSMNYTCNFAYNQNVGATNAYNVTCFVDDHTRNQCTKAIHLNEGYYGVCGNGALDDGEECDLGTNIGTRIRLGTYLDLNQNYLAGVYGNGNYYCQNCRIREYETNEFVYQPPQCLGTNTTISVMQNELLPFWWRLRERSEQLVENSYNCNNISDNETKTIIDKNSMKCTFSIYDGDGHQQINDNPLDTFVTDCYQKDSSIIFDYFEKAYKIDFNKVAGKYVYNFASNIKTYGEYKLVLEKVDYNYCSPSTKTWESGRTYQGICEVNFALTRPYIMQISTFGIDPIATSSDFLKDFYDMRGNPLVSKTDIDDTISVDSVSYGFNNEVSKQMSAFKQKYEALSIAVDKNFKVRGNTTIADIFNNGIVKKVPNQMIFFVKGDGQLTLRQLTNHFPGTPFTIYVEGMNVLVEGSVKTNGMIITTNKISFEDDSSKDYCEEGGQVVNGIFIARGGFDSVSRTRNTDKNQERCPWGNLHVKGVLIGNGVDNLVNNRRSHLNDWFTVKSNLESAIKRERKNEIFQGAALLIEYNPTLWTQLPPGADSFTKTLDVYRK